MPRKTSDPRVQFTVRLPASLVKDFLDRVDERGVTALVEEAVRGFLAEKGFLYDEAGGVSRAALEKPSKPPREDRSSSKATPSLPDSQAPEKPLRCPVPGCDFAPKVAATCPTHGRKAR